MMPPGRSSSRSDKDETRRSALFRFHGTLTDFLDSDHRQLIPYTFRSNPSVKHAVESIGAPHPEVGSILVNSRQVGFSYLLQNGDIVDVHPVAGNWLYRDSPLRRRYRGSPRFVLDVHLGTLARRLRLLGFDTLYSNQFHDQEIALIASMQGRIVLTRDIGMLMWCDVVYGRWIRSQQPSKQLVEVLDHFSLRSLIRPFHRCTVCNGRIEQIDRAAARKEVKQEIWEHYREFNRCHSCGRIYWKGTHFQRMEQIISAYARAER